LTLAAAGLDGPVGDRRLRGQTMSRRRQKAETEAVVAAAPAPKPKFEPTAAEMKALAKATHFDEQEVSQLAQRFSALDHDGGGSLSADELLMMPELSMYPLLKRVLAMHNANKDENIDFDEFVRTMSMLSGKATLGEKLKFAFNIFDVNENGRIQPNEMFTVFRLLTGRMHDDVDLQQIVDSYLQRFPKGLTYDLFSQMFTISDLSKLTLNV